MNLDIRPKNTGFKDIRKNDIYANDIVFCDNQFGWIFHYEDTFGDDTGWFIGWDVVGPSCEDCISLKEIIEQNRYIKVVGTIKRYE